MPVLPNAAPALAPYGFARSLLATLLSMAVLAAFAARTPASRGPALSLRQKVIVILSLALLGLFVAIFLWSPASFYETSLEDGPVEWMSAILPIAASFLLVVRGASVLARARDFGEMSWPGVALVLSAAVLFALGMEEMSWMQRIFGFDTPQALSGNIQNELNLHNLATNQVGTLHKLVGFAFLVLLPFINATTPLTAAAPGLSPLIPSRCAALVAAPLASLNYNGWDFLPMQITTYMTAGIVVFFAWRAWRGSRPSETLLCAAMVLAIVAAQIVFITLGDRFVRIWDVTEYKELFIALGLFVWAVEAFDRLSGEPRRSATRR